ncbi:MAG TPA: BamA/TamA family outer membrane protein, partial [Cytophagaceae bacterium]
KGDKYDESKISQERERLTQIMKDNGYYDFTRQFIYFKVDTTIGKKQVDIELNLANPPKAQHEPYKIGKIYFNTDISELKNNIKQDTSFYRDIHFIYSNSYFSKKILSHKIKFKPGDYYNQTKVQQSQRQLGSMDMYKFVNINFEKDSSNTLIAYIHTSPLKKFQITQEYGVNVGNAWLPGPFLNVSYKNRNFLSGFEVFETSVRYSIDAQPSITNDDKSLTNQEFGLNFSLTFPQLYFPTRLRYKFINYNPRTKLQLGYTLTDRPDYVRKNLRAALTYNFSTTQYSQFLISPIDVNIINSVKTEAFQAFLKNLEGRGSNLIRSFNPSIVTNFNATYIFNNNEIGKIKTSRFFKVSFEIGGNIVKLLDETFEGVNTENKYFGKQYYQYYKINTDLRYYFPVKRKSVFAVRVNAGYARPYGNDSNLVLPYEKYFFAGGGNSIRGWKQRRLGPGIFKDSLNQYLYEQPGEIIFENNYEYRFNISGFFDGAVFLDAGNVWHNHDKSKAGAEFKYLNSIPDIALGTGVGLRLNFSFLILRFDFGYKLRDPSQPKGDRWVSEYKIKNTEINIGIGYPF